MSWIRTLDSFQNIYAYLGGGNADKIKAVQAYPPQPTTEVGVSHLNRPRLRLAGEAIKNKSLAWRGSPNALPAHLRDLPFFVRVGKAETGTHQSQRSRVRPKLKTVTKTLS